MKPKRKPRDLMNLNLTLRINGDFELVKGLGKNSHGVEKWLKKSR